MQHGKQPFWARLQLLARLTLYAGKHTGNQPARLAHLDDGNDRAILVQGDEGPAQVVRLRHRGTPSVHAATKLPSPRRPPHRISLVEVGVSCELVSDMPNSLLAGKIQGISAIIAQYR